VLVPDTIALRDTASLLASPRRVLSLDLRRASGLPDRVTASFRLARGPRVTGLCAFLRVHLDRRRSFSTGPDRTGTHWGQVFLPAFEPLAAGQGARLRVSLSMAERARDWRWTLDLESVRGSSTRRRTPR
jgi:hypothetical protein